MYFSINSGFFKGKWRACIIGQYASYVRAVAVHFTELKVFFHEKRLPRQWLVFFLVFFNTRMITDRTGLHVVIFPLQIGTAGYSLQAC